jgi:hypothetical protein
MTTPLDLTKRWVLLGIICGILANILYVIISVLTENGAIPPKLVYTLGWSFGPLVIVAGLGFYHYLRIRGESVRLYLAKLFMIAAGICVTLSITLRGVIQYEYLKFRPDATNQISITSWDYAYQALLLAQRGIELSWNIFIYLAVIFFALVMLTCRLHEKIIGALGLIIGLVGLYVDIRIWPTDPDELEMVNMGPFSGLWFAAIAIMMALHYKNLRTRS